MRRVQFDRARGGLIRGAVISAPFAALGKDIPKIGGVRGLVRRL